MASKWLAGGMNSNLLAYLLTQLVVAMLLMQQITGNGLFSGVMGLRKGDSADGIQHVKQFLHRYGYLDFGHVDLAATDHHSDSFDQQLETALKLYQENFQLDVTGELDAATVQEMGKTRCGVPDIINGTNYMKQRLHSSSNLLHAVSHFAFFPGGRKWPRSHTHLTYAFVHGHLSGRNDINSKIGSIVKQSFAKWAAASGRFTFKQVAAGKPSDIKIGFYKGHHGDGNPFDGPGGTLGHASPPTGGLLHLDLEELWSTRPGPTEADLESVIMHEMGHVLGLQHSFFPGAIMYPVIRGGEVRRGLTRDDVIGIRVLYHPYV